MMEAWSDGSDAGAANPETGLRGDDRDLLVAARRDPDAFAALYDRWYGPLTAFFATRTGCAHTAADLTAETVTALYVQRRRYRPARGEPGPWIWGIARNQLRHWQRSCAVDDRARRRLGVPPIEPDAEIEATVERVAFSDLGRELGDALGVLPPGVADAVRLRILNDLPYDEVASRLGCSEGAARVRVSRGLARLGRELARHVDHVDDARAVEVNP